MRTVNYAFGFVVVFQIGNELSYRIFALSHYAVVGLCQIENCIRH